MPVANSCVANIPEIKSLTHRIFKNFLETCPSELNPFRVRAIIAQTPRNYWPENSIRLNYEYETTRPYFEMISWKRLRHAFLQNTRSTWPSQTFSFLSRSLKLVRIPLISASGIRSQEYTQAVCGISIVRDYYKLQKFNVSEICRTRLESETFMEGQGRIMGWRWCYIENYVSYCS